MTKKEVLKEKKFKLDKKDIHTHKLSPIFDKLFKYQEFDESDIKNIDVEELSDIFTLIKIQLTKSSKIGEEK